MQKQKNLAVVIPVYNESSCIEKVVGEWIGALSFQKINFSLILVNDGSTDNTLEILNNLKVKHSQVCIIDQVNGGHGNALINGYHAAIEMSPEFIFQVDSDDQFKPRDFTKLWKLRNESPFISGIRHQRNDPWFRIVISKILKTTLNLSLGISIADANIPYRLIKTDFLQAMLHCLPLNCFAPNVFISALAKSYLGSYPEVEVEHIERQTGQVSLIRLGLLKACAKTFFELLKFSFELNYKVSKIELELNQKNFELEKLYA
ncbi:MAG: glycosyltransferase involved in cell wall biosynthesis [Bacteriovoracaceae bacterium]|jgi:glycosyltransferase involved in cell wall biosynthesis